MNDLIERLRECSTDWPAYLTKLDREAADALESQAKRIAELEPQADAYNFACEDMEKFQRERLEAGKEVGTQGSLCDGMAWVYGRLNELEAEVARLRVDAESFNWLVDNAILGFSSAPHWKTIITFDTADSQANTIRAAICAAKEPQ